MWYFTFAANNRLLRKNTTFSLSMFSNNLKIFLSLCLCRKRTGQFSCFHCEISCFFQYFEKNRRKIATFGKLIPI